MATRSASFDALILRARESPAGDRIVTLLSAEEGLIDAFAFGGPKSKLRSLASPWHSGRAWIYKDQAKGFIKLSDFDLSEGYSAIRSSLAAIGAASLASELIMATDALGGDWVDAHALMTGLLKALDRASPRAEEAQGVQAAQAALVEQEAVTGALSLFCLRAVSLTGVMPDTGECASCASEIGPNGLHCYTRRLGAFLCERCAAAEGDEDALIRLLPGSARWLSKAAEMDFSFGLNLGLAREALGLVKALALDLAAKAAHGRLKTLSSGLL
jgi:DNA repair protein RecO (recombination protein O)